MRKKNVGPRLHTNSEKKSASLSHHITWRRAGKKGPQGSFLQVWGGKKGEGLPAHRLDREGPMPDPLTERGGRCKLSSSAEKGRREAHYHSFSPGEEKKLRILSTRGKKGRGELRFLAWEGRDDSLNGRG